MTKENPLENWEDTSLALKSEGTAGVYRRHLNIFLRETKVTLQDMIKWDKETARRKLLKYMGGMKKRGIAHKTMGVAWYSLRDFFKANGIKIDEKIPISTKKRKYRDYIPTKAELRRILDHSPLQVKLGMCIMAFTGLGPEDAVALTYGNFKDDLEAGISPVMLTLRRTKTGEEFITFVPDQTIRYLKEWLECREKKGEKIDDKTPILTWTKSYAMSQKQTEYIKKAGIKVRTGFRLRNYGLRKYFRRGLLGKADESLAEFFMGHNTDLPGIYSGLEDLDPEAIKKAREIYTGALPDLITEGDISLNDFNEVKDKIDQLENENAKLKERLNGFSLALNSLSNGEVHEIAGVLARALKNKKKRE